MRDAELLETRVVGGYESSDYALRVEDGEIKDRLDRMDVRFVSLSETVANLPPDDLLERMTRAEERIKYLERACVKWAVPGGSVE